MPEKKENRSDERNTLVVGLGASAGGLNALQDFFKSIPPDPGMAFIVVLHLSPDKKSRLSEILQRETELEVTEVRERISIEENHVYVIPPNKLLSVVNNHLELTEPEKEHGIASIDLLFRTLGEKKKKYSAGLIFSGTGSDGVTGMKIIKEEGGITLAQNPEDAKHADMPSNVIQTGIVDKVLPVDQMAEELLEYRKSLYKVRISEKAGELSEEEDTETILSEIFKRIQSRHDHNFENYRRSSILRRLDRRMRVNRTHSLQEYLNYIDEFPDEIDSLYKDLLITVTSFFRDPDAFEALADKVIPKLFEGKEKDEQVRIWVPGCSSGEEAYSIAILIDEHVSNSNVQNEVQIFASDVDEESIEIARVGRYPQSIENDMSTERLETYFYKEDQIYIVKESLREMVLFASHNLLKNPPFSRQDLISCRNLLIYLNKDLQEEVFNLFHYALQDRGYLFLGKSESTHGNKDLFSTVNNKLNIYRQKTDVSSRISLPDMPLLNRSTGLTGYRRRSSVSKKKNLEKMHWSILARLYAPQSVILTEDYEVIHSTDGIDKYLQYKGGEPSHNILNMASPKIRQGLRSVLHQLKSKKNYPVKKNVTVNLGDESKRLELIARTFGDTELPQGIIHVVFKEVPEKQVEKKKEKKEKSGKQPEIIESLEEELEYTKEQLQLTVEQYETSNEELRASNEELQSMNEELQSTTEELETSQEELQSVNEELKTVNEQLESKVQELNRAHSDLENLMEATEVGIIFVDKNFKIQRFTSTATEIFNLIDSDKGRSLKDITHKLRYDTLQEDIRNVLEDLEKIKKPVATRDGRWFIMRLRPYRSSEDRIEGVVLSFTEFTELKEARQTIEEQSLQESLATLGLYALEHDNLEMIMHRAIQQTCALLQLKCAMVLRLREDNHTFELSMEINCNCEDVVVENLEKWDVGYVLKTKQPVTVIDYNIEDRFKISPIMQNKGITSSVLLSIRGTEEVFGVLAFYCDEKREFSKRDLHYLQVVANILGRSIEQKKNHAELQEANKRLQQEMEHSEELQKEILNTNILERWELGGYLHDNFGQLLASVKILVEDIRLKLADNDVDVKEEVGQINEIMDSCISGIRDIIHDIIPLDVEREGVSQAFRIVMNQTYKMYDVRCVLEEEDDILNEIRNREAATHLYHILQEAVKNAATHGNADVIVITTKKEDQKFILRIRDDGIGIEATPNGNGKGLRIMRHRMDILGGTFEIKEYSEDDQSGTIVTCTMPWKIIKEKREE